MMYFVVLIMLICSVSYSYGNHTLERSLLEKRYGIRYSTYTKDNQNEAVDIRDIKFNDNQKTVFIIHGYSSISLEKPLNLKENIFQSDPTVGRVIVVNWLDYSILSDTLPFLDQDYSSIAPMNYYEIAIKHVPLLAKDINEKMVYIRNNGAETMELIGHSLGAHIAGQSGRLFKEKIGTAVYQIVGLDPAGVYFENHPDVALKKNDAENVLVFHTNVNGYGNKNELGTEDIFVNGGKKQPNCKTKLMDDICSHSEAWQVYPNYLNDKASAKTDGRLTSQRYVLCMDISGSMQENNRLSRAIESAKDIISNMEKHSLLGIVTFSGSAKTIHGIVEIKGNAVRESLISVLPTYVQWSGTSIGAGLRLSMEMLKSLPDSDLYYSTIFLITDGEQNAGEGPDDILPALQKSCIRINSVGLGTGSSEKLEEIGKKTNGVVSYVMENERSQQIVDTRRAFAYSYEHANDADIRPIYLPSKQVTLSNRDSTVVPFIIDEHIGKDTKFNFASDQMQNINVKLTSPSGKIYSSASPEYGSTLTENYFKIDLAERGQWNLTATKISKRKRSLRSTFDAIVSVKTHQIDDKTNPVRLDATVSSRTLDYPKPIIISAELRIGQFPIIHAEVRAHIRGSNQLPVSLQLNDDGAFPDELANDGVYSASVSKLANLERYSVFVTGKSNGSAKLVPRRINYFTREFIDCKNLACKTLTEFEREADVGSIKLLSKDHEDEIPPNRVNNLRAIVQNKDLKQIALEWTSPVDKVFDMNIERYDIRALINSSEFENAVQFNDTDVVEGSLNAVNSTTRKIEKILLKIPDHIWNIEPNILFEMRFALKAIGKNNVTSSRSNLASAIISIEPSSRYPVIHCVSLSLLTIFSIGICVRFRSIIFKKINRLLASH